MKFLVSLLGLGISGGGIFIGTLQQNLSNTKTEIDKLFEEIEDDIRKFSEENPLTEKNACEIKKCPDSSSVSDSVNRKRRDVSNTEEKKPEHTLGIWTDIWVGLLSSYISSLWLVNNRVSTDTLDEKSKNFSSQQKQEAIKYADKQNKEEKERFEEKLSSKQDSKNKIEDIYRKMKEFILQIEFPENYKYNTSTDNESPYENYIKNLEWN